MDRRYMIGFGIGVILVVCIWWITSCVEQIINENFKTLSILTQKIEDQNRRIDNLSFSLDDLKRSVDPKASNISYSVTVEGEENGIGSSWLNGSGAVAFLQRFSDDDSVVSVIIYKANDVQHVSFGDVKQAIDFIQK